jgi:hypothetical protein
MLSQAVVQIAAFSSLAFAALLFAVQAAAKEIGYRLGARRRNDGETPPEGVGVVVGGMLGLLAFVLALTLSFANARFQERREGTLAEANAIGTAWLRAHAVEEPRGAEIARLLEDYTRLRIAFVQATVNTPNLAEVTARSNALQTVMWGHLTAILRERRDPVAAALMTALNDTFDLATSERFAFALPLPSQLFWLLVGMSCFSMASLGYQLGLRGGALRGLSFVLIGMWTATMTIILDLGAARVGDIRVGTAAYEWTLQSFQGGVPIPPLR